MCLDAHRRYGLVIGKVLLNVPVLCVAAMEKDAVSKVKDFPWRQRVTCVAGE
jgi:hypothetical protein